MPLSAGRRLGPYEIEAPVGAGGMGEVYRAKDTRLGRTVAIKVLPAGHAERPGFRERFEREARAVATLSHPFVCTLYDVGSEDGAPYLVMEFVEGETLSDRLSRRGGSTGSGLVGGLSVSPSRSGFGGRGVLSIAQALKWAIQIAEALGAAHREGIVHRDLKPSNVLLTRNGVKVVDFGLARLVREPAEADTRPREERSGAPTAEVLTKEATVLGTVPYMSPEQLEGRPADPRSDIFALGAVLFEMLTGRRAFDGASEASLIAGILEHDPPPVSTMRMGCPAALDRVVKLCLMKDPDARWQSAADLARELQWVLEEIERADTGARVVSSRRRRRALVSAVPLAGVLVLAAFGVRGLLERRKVATPRPLTLEITVRNFDSRDGLALAPDGRRLAFPVRDVRGESQLYVRSLDAPDARPIVGTEGASRPFWSPDSGHVAFVAGRSLRRVDVTSGAVQTIASISDPERFRGGSWGGAGTVVFAIENGGISAVNADGGGAPWELVRGEPAHPQVWQPTFLPDGRRFLFPSLSKRTARQGLYLGSLDGSDVRFVADLRHGVDVLPDGHCLYARDGRLFAQRFDLPTATFIGTPTLLATDVVVDGGLGLRGAFSASHTGLVAYRRTSPRRAQLTFFDRLGARLGVVGEPGDYRNFDLSPDGRAVVFARRNADTGRPELWITDVARGATSLFVSGPHHVNDPVWLPDGRSIAFNLDDPKRRQIVARPAVGGSDRELIGTEAHATSVLTEDVSRDGRWLAFLQQVWTPEANTHYGGLKRLDADDSPIIFGLPGIHVDEVHFSPDARFVAWSDNATGRPEIYVAPVPPGEQRFQVSTSGGVQPRFREDGREIYYLAPDGWLMAASLELGDKIKAGSPTQLFQLPIDEVEQGSDQYDVTPDGKRFLVVAITTSPRDAPVSVLVNWPALLESSP